MAAQKTSTLRLAQPGSCKLQSPRSMVIVGHFIVVGTFKESVQAMHSRPACFVRRRLISFSDAVFRQRYISAGYGCLNANTNAMIIHDGKFDVWDVSKRPKCCCFEYAPVLDVCLHWLQRHSGSQMRLLQRSFSFDIHSRSILGDTRPSNFSLQQLEGQAGHTSLDEGL